MRKTRSRPASPRCLLRMGGAMAVRAAVLSVVSFLAWAPPAEARSLVAELYTMGPGDELFTKFGHAALCVETPEWTPAWCFNYGTTDFSRPVGLTLDVLRGRAEFFVSVVDVDTMLDGFRYDDRTVYRQRLPFSDEQVLRLARELRHDALPENRAYVYDHFLDNCSTKPRDLIDGVSDGALRSMARRENPTYRNLVDEKLGYSRLLIFLSDLCLGRSLDKETTYYEAMFLPFVLRDAVAERFEAAPERVHARTAPLPLSRPESARLWIGLLLVGAAIAAGLAVARGTARWAGVARPAAGLAAGGLGALVLLLAVLSPETEIRYNENLLVFLPTDLLFVAGQRKLVRAYTRLRLAELGVVGLLAATGVLVQPLWFFWCAALALTASIALRGSTSRRRDV